MSKYSLKLYDSDDEDPDTKVDVIGKDLPKPPFRWVILGATGSGKTVFIKNIIFDNEEGDFGYNKYFDEIYVWSGSIDDAKKFVALLTKYNIKNVNIRQTFDENDVKSLFTSIEDDIKQHDIKPRILFVLDDQLWNGISSRYKDGIIDNIFYRGRHLGISILIAAQKYAKLNQNVRRDNVSHITIFAGVNNKELDMVVNEHCNGKDEKQMLAIIKAQLDKPHSYVTIPTIGNLLDKNFQPLYIQTK